MSADRAPQGRGPGAMAALHADPAVAPGARIGGGTVTRPNPLASRNPVASRNPLAGRPITLVQAAVLGYVVRYTASHGYAPTLREIAAWAGWVNSAVSDMLGRLERAGYVRACPGVHRGLLVLRRDALVDMRHRSKPSSALAAQARGEA